MPSMTYWRRGDILISVREAEYLFTIYIDSLCQRCALLNPTTKFEKVFEIKTAVSWLNTLRPRQSCRHFADVIFRSICLNENVQMSLKISLRLVPKVWLNNTPAVVQVMAWGWAGTKKLSEPVIVSLLTHICVARPQWVNICGHTIACLVTPASMTF